MTLPQDRFHRADLSRDREGTADPVTPADPEDPRAPARDPRAPARPRVLLLSLWLAGLGSFGVFLVYALTGGVVGLRVPEEVGRLAQLLPYGCAAAILMLRAATVRWERLPWLLLGLAALSSGLGLLYYQLVLSDLAAPPYPSPSDGLWLSYYGLSLLALAMLMRERLDGYRGSMWIDAAIASLAIAAVAAGVVIHPLLGSSTGGPMAIATTLLYPVSDLIVVTLVLGIFALQAWKPDPFWAMIGGAWLVQAIVDAVYLRQVAEGTYEVGGALDGAWIVAILLISYAAWAKPGKPGHRRPPSDWNAIAVPAFFTLVAVAIVVYGNFVSVPFAVVLLALLALVAGVGRMVVEFRHQQHLRDLARHDSLTGLLNRRGFQRVIDQELSESARANSSLSLVIIDLDDFKLINDQRGHLDGDMALERFAAIVLQAVRRNDAVARMGGEEFAVILCETPAAAAFAFAERVRVELQKVFADTPTPLTASFGVASFPEDGRSAEELHGAADRAMYAAKALGKNRTLASEPETAPLSTPVGGSDGGSELRRLRVR